MAKKKKEAAIEAAIKKNLIAQAKISRPLYGRRWIY